MIDISNVIQKEGMLVASSSRVVMCGDCENAHFELFDSKGKIFAVCHVAPEDFRDFSATFVKLAERAEKMGIINRKGLS